MSTAVSGIKNIEAQTLKPYAEYTEAQIEASSLKPNHHHIQL
jgi:hypothetical protein